MSGQHGSHQADMVNVFRHLVLVLEFQPNDGRDIMWPFQPVPVNQTLGNWPSDKRRQYQPECRGRDVNLARGGETGLRLDLRTPGDGRPVSADQCGGAQLGRDRRGKVEQHGAQV